MAGYGDKSESNRDGNARAESEAQRVERFTRWEDIAPHREAWDALTGAAGDVFGSYEWCRTWWEFYGGGRRLDVRLVWRGGELAAIFRFFRETQWCGGLPVRFVRLVGCDFGVAPGRIAIREGLEDEAIGALAGSFRGADDWDVIHLGLFPGYVELEPVITDALRKHFAEADVRCQADAGPTVLLDVPGSVEEYLKSLGKEKRRHVNRAQKELTKAHRTGFRLRQTHEEMAEVMERFFEAHEVFWRKRGLRGYFNEWPKAKEFHRRLVERLAPGGRAFMAELVADDAVVARTYGYRSGGIIHSMQTTREDGREWESMGVGHIIFLRMVEHAIAAGVKTVDRGGRPIAYKLEMGGRLAPMKLVTITRRGKGTAARLTLFRAAAWVLDKAYDGLWYRRIAPRIGMTGKPYWDVWVRSRIALPGGGEVREVKAE